METSILWYKPLPMTVKHHVGCCYWLLAGGLLLIATVMLWLLAIVGRTNRVTPQLSIWCPCFYWEICKLCDWEFMKTMKAIKLTETQNHHTAGKTHYGTDTMTDNMWRFWLNNGWSRMGVICVAKHLHHLSCNGTLEMTPRSLSLLQP